MEDRVGLGAGAGTDVAVFASFVTSFVTSFIAIAIAIAVAEYDRKVEPNKRHKRRTSPVALRLSTDSVAIAFADHVFPEQCLEPC